MQKFITTTVLALAVLANTAVSRAAEAQEAPKKTAARSMPFNGKITAVDKAALTVSLEGKEKPRVFQLTASTKINRDKKPTTLDDVTVGERVGGYARENADGKMEVMTLNVGLPDRTAKAKETDAPADHK